MALIALGVCGGIGAYKAVEITRGLQKRGHDVAAIMTRSACRFVGPVTFEAITRRRVITDQFAEGSNADIEHIALATEAALLVVAPATANVIGKFAHGIADDFLTSLYLATRAPVLMAPAMNTQMFDHDAVRANMELLATRGIRFVDPGEGYLACGWIGKGRLAEPEDVVEAADAMLRPSDVLAGRFVLVTAGPTYEDLDDVRFIGNRSSGRMGYAIAQEAARRGARVVLVSGPSSLPAPAGVEVIRVRSAAEMHAAVMPHAATLRRRHHGGRGGRLHAPHARRRQDREGGRAARPRARTDPRHPRRARRGAGGRRPAGCSSASRPRAATRVRRAREKLARKNADMIVANDISRPDAGFDADTNAVILVTADGDEPVPLAPKTQIAARILDRAQSLLARPVAG